MTVTSSAPVKVVLTSRAAAQAKYGRTGWAAIRHAITELIAADADRGLTTRFLALDSAADARRVGAVPVDDPTDAAAAKAYVDAVAARLDPAYLVLLGGPELVPTVPLRNPMSDGTPQGDPDPSIASDLPYACPGLYSTSPSDYAGATRVVGRVPDLPGDTDHAVLVDQLHAAAAAVPQPSPVTVFGLSTRSWLASTRQSVHALPVPAAAAAVRTSPADGPAWTAADLTPALHFVNCHGAEFDPHWYGEVRSGQVPLPVAMDGAELAPIIAAGTVVAAECCYATSLWTPAAAGGRRSVALEYLLAGAAGVFGATTTAYGPISGNEYADVIARLFAEAVLSGASLGRAALVARQRYVQAEGYLDPTSLTTLAQFSLLGDPSVQPFQPIGAAPGPAPAIAAAVAVSKGSVQARRVQLAAVGAALQAGTAVSSDRPRRRASLTTGRLSELVGEPVGGRVRTFGAARTPAGVAAPRSHVAVDRTNRRAVIVREQPGSLPEVRVVHAK